MLSLRESEATEAIFQLKEKTRLLRQRTARNDNYF